MPDQDPLSEARPPASVEMQVIVPPSFRSAIAALASGVGTNEPVRPWFKDTYSRALGPLPKIVGHIGVG